MTTDELNRVPWRARAHRDRRHNRTFREPLFLRDSGIYSERLCYRLHKRLEEAFQALSGEQQNGGMGYEYDEKSGNEDYTTLVAVVQEVALALVGREVVFKPLPKEQDSIQDIRP